MPKTAEALAEHNGLQDRINLLQAHLAANAKVQEGDTPDEPPAALVNGARAKLVELKRSNFTNLRTTFPGSTGSVNLIKDVVKRGYLCQERKLLEMSGVTRTYFNGRAIVDVAEIQIEIDSVSKIYQVDIRTNWLTNLIQN